MRPNRQPYKRAERVADVLRQALSEILLNRIQHHNLEKVTVTGVQLTDDLQHARVFYRVLDPEHREESAEALAEALPLIRRELGSEVRLRYTPDLRFEYDESLDYGNRIDALLRSLHLPPREEE